jgi:hypothetical protein
LFNTTLELLEKQREERELKHQAMKKCCDGEAEFHVFCKGTLTGGFIALAIQF